MHILSNLIQNLKYFCINETKKKDFENFQKMYYKLQRKHPDDKKLKLPDFGRVNNRNKLLI